MPFYEVDVEKYISTPERYTPRCYISLPGMEGADFVALYHGRAMGDAVPAGSLVVVRKVDMTNLIPGGDYVVVSEEFIMLRRIRREAGSEVLRLLPVDTNHFDEILIATTAVRELYIVLAVVINKTI